MANQNLEVLKVVAKLLQPVLDELVAHPPILKIY
jgi:hypothetical protein